MPTNPLTPDDLAALRERSRVLGYVQHVDLIPFFDALESAQRLADQVNSDAKESAASNVADEQEDEKELEELRAQVTRLEQAIRAHRDARGDDRCWMDDEALYKALPEGYTPPERDSVVELALCRKFIASRQNPVTTYVSPQRAIEAAEARAAQAEATRDRLRLELNLIRAEKPHAFGCQCWTCVADRLAPAPPEVT